MFFHNSLGVRMAHAVLSPLAGTLLRRLRFLRRDTSSSGGRWATASGKELKKQFRKWLTAAERADNSTPYNINSVYLKTLEKGQLLVNIKHVCNNTNLQVHLKDMFCTSGDKLANSYSLQNKKERTECQTLNVKKTLVSF